MEDFYSTNLVYFMVHVIHVRYMPFTLYLYALYGLIRDLSCNGKPCQITYEIVRIKRALSALNDTHLLATLTGTPVSLHIHKII